MMRRVAVTLACAALFGCFGGDRITGLHRSGGGGGPRVVFDFDAKPVPDVPFPNDLGAQPDPSSPTGMRLSLPAAAPTRFERWLRRQFNNLSGFGNISPITVSFDAAIDIRNLKKRHADHDFGNDAVYLVDLDFGAAVELDIGKGNYPVTIQPGGYFGNDPNERCATVLFGCRDVDGDGAAEETNVAADTGRRFDDLVQFYDFDTNTLIMRPVVPLRDGGKYAVVLTKKLTNGGGRPVRSPFPYVNHALQTEALRPLPAHLEKVGLSLDDVAFTWAFTVQDSTGELIEIRRGLWGEGPFRSLGPAYPAELDTVAELVDEKGLPPGGDYNLHTLPGETILEAIKGILPAVESSLGYLNKKAEQSIIESYQYVDYVVQGELMSPNLRDTICPGEPGHDPGGEHVFKIDLATGQVRSIPCRIAFWASVPKRREGAKPPFPVVLYQHGTGGNRLQLLLDAGFFAEQGVAAVAIDAVAHGLFIPPGLERIVSGFFKSYGMSPILGENFFMGRAIDLNGDGTVDPGGDIYTADMFKTRDNIRQTLADWFQVARVVHGFDGKRRWDFDVDGDGGKELAGDFNADGEADFGGPDVEYYATGVSLGGIVSSILGAVEPLVRAAAPISGGGGLIDIAVREADSSLVKSIYPMMMGQIFTGLWDADGNFTVSQVAVEQAPYTKDRGSFPEIAAVVDKWKESRAVTGVRLRNLGNGEVREATAFQDGGFRVAIPADEGDRLEIEVKFDSGEPRLLTTLGEEVVFRSRTHAAGEPLSALDTGLGIERNTLEMRKIFELATTAVSAGDPINYMKYYSTMIPGPPFEREGADLLVSCTPGDLVVSIHTCIAMARAARLVPYDADDPRYGMPPNDLLIEKYVTEGLNFLRFGADPGHPVLFDVDDLDNGKDGYDAPTLEQPLRLTFDTLTGKSGVRFPFVTPWGGHGVTAAETDAPYDPMAPMMRRIAIFFASGGKRLIDDECLDDGTCE